MSLVLYADETGTDYKVGWADKTRIMGIAGYIAYPDDWAKLNVAWKRVLDEFKVDRFHYSELKPNVRSKPGTEYYGWTGEQADDFLDKLSTIAGTIPLFGFAALVAVKDYEKKLPQFHKDLYEHPYFFCLHLFLNMVLDGMQKGFVPPGAQYSLCLNNSPKFKERAPKVWDWIKYEFDIHNRMGSQPTFEDNHTCLPLQCADLLIYRMRRIMDDQLYRDKNGFKKFDITKLEEQLGAKGKLLVQSYGGKHLDALVQRHVDEVRRDRLAVQHRNN